jgi:hypothetical protein
VAANPPAQAEALILIPLTLVRIDDLDFGTVISSPVSGTVMIPAMAARVSCRRVTLDPSDRDRARFAGAGSTRMFSSMHQPGTLSDGAGNAVTYGLTLDGLPVRTIDATRHSFYVGGILQIGANQPEAYRRVRRHREVSESIEAGRRRC